MSHQNKKIHDKRYREKNKEKLRLLRQAWAERNREKDRAYKKKWRDNNKEHERTYQRERRKKDLHYCIKGNLYHRVNMGIQGYVKSERTMTLIGCTIDFLKEYIANKFTEGMSWDNYGEWHIDHIIPICKFDLTKPEEQQKCFHYTNMQPLWAKDNLKKGGKIDNFGSKI